MVWQWFSLLQHFLFSKICESCHNNTTCRLSLRFRFVKPKQKCESCKLLRTAALHSYATMFLLTTRANCSWRPRLSILPIADEEIRKSFKELDRHSSSGGGSISIMRIRSKCLRWTTTNETTKENCFHFECEN
jgi:hypothetical protein